MKNKLIPVIVSCAVIVVLIVAGHMLLMLAKIRTAMKWVYV